MAKTKALIGVVKRLWSLGGELARLLLDTAVLGDRD